ncbi:MAG: hypothetical protein K0R81_2932 [Microbacterium sp.]|nr:hypothetical protein [Microbacterium sp.]
MNEIFNPRAYYREQKPHLKRLAKEVKFALATEMAFTSIKLHGVSVRVKEKKSYLEKILRKSYSDPVSEVEDLVGARIVCLYVSDLDDVIARVSNLFDVIDTEDKLNSGPTDAFGYMSMHLICKIPDSLSGPRYAGLHAIKFEVQIRTILMDAWANVSHHLAYKGDASIPDGLRRDFHALAGLFYVADSHFEMLSARAKDADDDAQRATSKEGDHSSSPTPLNRSTLQAYIDRTYADRQSIQPTDSESVSELVEELAEYGYTSIEEVHEAISPHAQAILEYEERRPPADDRIRLYTAVGLIRTGLAIANERYAEEKYLEEVDDYARLREGLGMGPGSRGFRR